MEVNASPAPQERTWAMFSHLSALAGYIIPFGNIIGPLVVWQLKKNELPLVDDQGKEAVNFQISVTIYVVVAAILSLIGIGFLLLGAVALFNIVMLVVAALKANEGVRYRYPLSIRLVK